MVWSIRYAEGRPLRGGPSHMRSVRRQNRDRIDLGLLDGLMSGLMGPSAGRTTEPPPDRGWSELFFTGCAFSGWTQ